jgi:hypothetical protein
MRQEDLESLENFHDENPRQTAIWKNPLLKYSHFARTGSSVSKKDTEVNVFDENNLINNKVVLDTRGSRL